MADIGSLVRLKKESAFTSEYAEKMYKEGIMRLQSVTKTFLLRRTKMTLNQRTNEPILQLPKRCVNRIDIDLAPAERDLYEAFRVSFLSQFEDLVAQGNVMRNYTHVLVMILRLRQICCHPHLVEELFNDYAQGKRTVGTSFTLPRVMHFGGYRSMVTSQNTLQNSVVDASQAGIDSYPEAPSVIKKTSLLEDDDDEILNACFNDGSSDMSPKRRNPSSFKENDPLQIDKKLRIARNLMTPAVFARVCSQANMENGILDSECPHCLDVMTDPIVTSHDVSAETLTEGCIFVLRQEGDCDLDSCDTIKFKEFQEEERDSTDAIEPDILPITKADRNKSNECGKPITLAESLRLIDKAIAAFHPDQNYLGFIYSSKMNIMIELLQQIFREEEGLKVVIFSQFTKMLDIVETALRENGMEQYGRYDGKMSVRERSDAVDDFLSEDIPILLVSLKAGAVGLNLTRASRVILLDVWWNPAVEEQAIDRVHRIGQTRDVYVYRLVVKDSVEDQMLCLQERKREIAKGAVGEGDIRLDRLTLEDLKLGRKALLKPSAPLPTSPLPTTTAQTQASMAATKDSVTVDVSASSSAQSSPDSTAKKPSFFSRKPKEVKPKENAVSFAELFQFADSKDRIMIAIATVFSLGIGALIPSAILILGNVLNNAGGALGGGSLPAGVTFDPSPMYPTILNFVYFGIAMMVCGYLSQCFWTLSGENQGRRIRELYLQSILRQDLGWFDMAEEGSLTTRLAQDTNLIQDGISEKFGLCIQCVAQFVTGFIISFVKGPTLALVLLASIPVMAGVGITMFYFLTKLTREAQDSYADAGAVAEQVIAGIRTVYSFSLQNRFAVKYDNKLEKAEKADQNRGVTLGIGFGCFIMTMFMTYGLAFWYGSHKVYEGSMTAGDVLVTFMSLLMGTMALMMLPPNLSAVGSGRGAAFKIFATIKRIPTIDSMSTAGEKPATLKGQIEFKGVAFAYPTRPDTQIFENFSFIVEPGQTVAFVGPSGSGKSSTVQLVQRFYDPLSGSVHLDGRDITTLNVAWLRQQIGVVSQEPCLFNTTIKQNILMGAIRDDVTEAELVEVCKMANCHAFIMKLPNGYDTQVGEHGGMLSGGQKQRIAIARALIKNPKILLLDEATSALDTQSERLVQAALDTASSSRTTIVIAHRLSTIRNADKIVVLDKGKIIEVGTHNELVALGGVYNSLVEKQKIKARVEEVLESKPLHEIEEEFVTELEMPSKYGVKDSTGDIIETRLVLEDRAEMASALKKARENAKAHEKQLLQRKAPIWRVLMLMKPEWKLIALGIFGACGAGVVFPVFSLIFSTVITLLLDPTQVWPAPFQGANLYAFLFVVIGLATFVCFSLQFIGFELAGASLTRRLRLITFKAMVRQEVGFFDQEEHSLGALTSRLAIDASKVGELITKVWADLAQLIVTALCGLTIALYYSWQLCLVVLLATPFLIVSAYYESKIRRGFEDSTKKAYEESGTIAAEAFKEIRTVAALTREKYFEARYSANLEKPHGLALEKAKYASLGNGMTQAFTQFMSALGFYAGLRFVEAGIIEFSALFKVLMAVMLTSQGLGRSSTFLETYTKAKIAAINTFEIVDRKSSIDPEEDGPEFDQAENVKGGFDFKDVVFTYPARPEHPVFNGHFSLSGAVNQTVALVGPSGCGKSSAIGMLQRWYDVMDGNVGVDSKNVKNYQLKKLRGQMALVGQEPTLFDMTIRENILAGSERTNISESELDEIAKMANIHTFISEFPDGYGKLFLFLFLFLAVRATLKFDIPDTRVGDKGSQLSGGQKQRVAIARALIRNPRFLLLDEATSALDSESEKLVQQAIDNAVNQGGRTTITIAHRLSTIQNSDVIAVVKDGAIAELGTHNELLSIENGVYAALVKQQDLNVLA
ncbi:Multidrug resistance protein 1 [Entophlyctis luteolus]|nr:Multidrug resistance protein 1 [Entophlyctis luteolus]